VRDTIAQLNPVLRGWGAYFRTGNAAIKFGPVDASVAWRLTRLRVKRHGRDLRPGRAAQWTPDFFHALGLHRLRGTIRYPEAASCRVPNAPWSAVCGTSARTV
jgi:RNA-directed DNA polymerase